MIMKWKMMVLVGCAAWTFWGVGQATLAYEVVEVVNGGTIIGHVNFQGTPPAPIRFEVKKNPEVCGPERELTKVEVQNGHLKGAVVLLQDVKKGKAFQEKTLRGNPHGEGTFHHDGGESLSLHVQEQSCNFGPFTGVVPFQELVDFRNHDLVKHTVHTYSARGRKTPILRSLMIRDLFSGSELEEAIATEKLIKTRVVVLTCDRHDFMENWLYVVENPYFSISDQEGHFQIDQVPPGKYDLVVWHPVLGIQEQTVTVAANDSITMNFEFSKK